MLRLGRGTVIGFYHLGIPVVIVACSFLKRKKEPENLSARSENFPNARVYCIVYYARTLLFFAKEPNETPNTAKYTAGARGKD